jgi:hypothetical protein
MRQLFYGQLLALLTTENYTRDFGWENVKISANFRVSRATLWHQ